MTLAVLYPFIAKPFHMDDALFIWTAKHLQTSPFDFYGFTVNWEGTAAPMSSVTQNPPLAAYYLALIGWIFGWSEVALHAGLLLPAMAVVVGTARLAGQLGANPLWAGLGVIAAPVFVLSSTSVMCDTMMLAFWVWAMSLWIEGLQTQSGLRLLASVICIAAASLTKYFGVSLIPLLLVFSWLEGRPVRTWLPFLTLPIIVLAAYQAWTYHLYGGGLLGNAVAYATQLQVGGELPSKVLATFAFVGGGMAALLFAVPLLWGARRMVAGLITMLLVGALAMQMKTVGIFAVADAGGVRWSFVVQLAVWVVTGASVLLLAIAGWRQRKSPSSVLLFLWVAGTLVFTAAVNWAVSGRNVLPMIPAVSILMIRRFEARQSGQASRFFGLALAPSLILALLAAQADYRLAASARDAAAALKENAAVQPATLWFEGHWGFQYYMEALGAVALDKRILRLSSGDAVVIPTENSYFFDLPNQPLQHWFTHDVRWAGWLSTMEPTLGAGYYSDGWGPLPFAFGDIPPEQYMVYRFR